MRGFVTMVVAFTGMMLFSWFVESAIDSGRTGKPFAICLLSAHKSCD